MINLDVKQAMEIILNRDSVVAEIILDTTELQFKAMFGDAIGKTWNLGEVSGTLISAQWFDKAMTPYGMTTFKLQYDLELVERKPNE